MVWLKRIALAVVLLVVVLLVVGLFLPRNAQVERSLFIQAPPAVVYTEVSDFNRFNAWSPWYGEDPQARYTVSGQPGQAGHQLRWQSAKPEVGNGAMTLVEANPPGYVGIKLDFGPQGQADSYFRIRPVNGGSNVTWGFQVDFGNDVIGRYVGLMLGTMVGNQYQKGLENLKKVITQEEKRVPDDNG